jgi:hypothetical protein
MIAYLRMWLCQSGQHSGRRWVAGHLCTGCWARAWREGRA